MAATPAGREIRNLALDPLEALVGAWRIEITNAEFLQAGEVLTGSMSVTWLDGRALLVLRSVIDGGPPASVQVVGRNEDREDFQLLYADERGVSRIFAMTLAAGHWSLSREDPGFHQRLHARLSTDGNRITGAWSKSHDAGRTWQHDFDISYTKVAEVAA